MKHKQLSDAADISSGNLDDIDFFLLNQEDEDTEELTDEEDDFDVDEADVDFQAVDELEDEADEEEIEVRPRRKHRKKKDSLSSLTLSSAKPSVTLSSSRPSDLYSAGSLSVDTPKETAEISSSEKEEKPIISSSAKPLPDSVKKKIGRRRFRWIRLTTKLFFLGSFTALSCWAACGVSLESNFSFWQETFQNNWMQTAGELFGHVQQMVGQVHELIGMIVIP